MSLKPLHWWRRVQNEACYANWLLREMTLQGFPKGLPAQYLLPVALVYESIPAGLLLAGSD
jgi:hypothetical protein